MIRFFKLIQFLLLGCVINPGSAIASAISVGHHPDMIELQSIVVSAVRGALSPARMAQNISIYRKEDIRRHPVRDLGDMLRYVPGVAISPGSGLAQPVSASIYGSNSRDVLVMVDDIPFNTQLSGQANPSRIPVGTARRVEVLKGASSSAWGSSLGGVVNVITENTGDSAVPHGNISNSFGSLATRKNSIDIKGAVGKAGYYFYNSLFESKGLHFQSPAKDEKTFGKLSLPLNADTKLSTSFGYSGGKIQDRIPSTNRINKTPYVSRYGKIRLDVNKPGADTDISYKYNDQNITSDLYNATTGAKVSLSTSSNLYHGASVNTSMALRDNDRLNFGTDLEWDTIKSSNYLTTAKSINIQAPYANYILRLGPLDLNPGLRFDRNNRFGQQLSPSMGTVLHSGDNDAFEWRTRISRAFNAPPLMWIMNNDPVFLTAANPDLKAERACVYETGFGAHSGALSGQVNFYRMDVTDSLATVYNSALGAYQKQNTGKARRSGVDGKIDYALTHDLKTYVAGSINNPVNRATRQRIRGNGAILHSVGWGMNYENAALFGTNVYGHYDRWDSLPGQANDRKIIMDLQLTKKWKDLFQRFDTTLFLNVNNLTNSKYWSDPVKPSTERYFESGLTVSF
jgi:vitamin B12 transporter